MKLRIATYNIHKGVSPFGSRPRIHALKQAVSTLHADLLFLQEVQGRHDLLAAKHASNWPEEGQHDFLAGDDSYHVAYGMNAVYDHGHHGNALVSRYPIASFSNQDVSDHAFEKRGILHCVVRVLDPVDIHCFVIHLGLFSRSRKRQTDALIRAVTELAPGDAPVIIAGDFNDWTNQLSDKLRAELNVREVFDESISRRGFGTYLRRLAGRGPTMKPARTFPAAMPILQLDRIYVRGFTVENAEVLHGGLWAKLSDHAPIVATLHLE